MDRQDALDEERCPGCRGLIVDGVCPYCTSPIAGLQPVEPDPLAAPAAMASRPPAAYWAVCVLVLLIGLAWIGLAIFFYRVSRDSGPGGGSLVLYSFALVHLAVGLFSAYAAVTMMRRSYNVQGQLVLASVLGIGWGTFITLLFEQWWLSAATPFYLVVAVFALAGSRYFQRSFV